MAAHRGTGFFWILLSRCRTPGLGRSTTPVLRPLSSQPPPPPPAGTWTSRLSRLSHQDLYRLSLTDPDQFWGSAAADRLRWVEPFHQVQDCDLSSGKIRWFLGGKINVSVNCLDVHVEKHPDRVALIWERDEPGTEVKVSYRELLETTCRLANTLKSHGIQKGDRVAIYMPVSPLAVAAMLACARIGAVHAVVFAGFSSEALAGRIQDAQCRAVLTCNQAVRGGRVIELKSTVDAAVKICPSVQHVFVSQRTQQPAVMGELDVPLEEDGDVFGCVADIGWITGHSYVVYGPLCNGATTVLFESSPVYPDPVGEPINHEAWHWFHSVVGDGRCPVVDTWWQTETGGICIAPRPAEDGASIVPAMAMRPFFGIEPVLMGEKGEEVGGASVSGALCIRQPWPGLARSVFRDHQRFVDSYFKPFPGCYFTGDGACRSEDGHYQITGRMDDVINVSGHRLGTAEIEDALDEHPAVPETAVVGIPHDIKGEVPFAFVVVKQDPDDPVLLLQQLRNLVATKIAKYAVPAHFLVVKRLPKTRSGKILRRILRKVAMETTGDLGDVSTLDDPSVVKEIVEAHKLYRKQRMSGGLTSVQQGATERRRLSAAPVVNDAQLRFLLQQQDDEDDSSSQPQDSAPSAAVDVKGQPEQIPATTRRSDLRVRVQRPFRSLSCGEEFTSRSLLQTHQAPGGLRRHQLTCERTDRKFRCAECGREFRQHSYLSDHLRVHLQDKPFTCPTCQKGFTTHRILHVHQQSVHGGLKPFTCTVCRKSFSQRSGLTAHLRTHSGERPHACERCGKRFSSRSSLTVHQRVHTGEKAFGCDACGKKFSFSANLRRHRLVHSGVRAFTCDECGRSFSQAGHLKVHRAMHSAEWAFICGDCGKGFRQRGALLLHERSHAGVKPFGCSECGKTFSSSVSLRRHQLVHSKKRVHACSECGRSFTSAQVLKTHLQLHGDRKPFTCDVCGRGYSSRSYLTMHRRSHSEGKPFSCSQCDKSFSSQASAALHLRTHSGEKPFVCEVCGKNFSVSQNLVRHKRVHSGEKPFSCDVCGKRFSQNNNLKTHQLLHTGHKPFSCAACSRRFTARRSLRVHKCVPAGTGQDQDQDQV
ncbi:hypothetical protein F2P81_020661 [Scophthalmus maximus]|uniref:Propionate--CoA ligase n=1 Tax=Scophthalmus maximus TaxID=52904 RepID=A0A6A4S8M6_SCOMX|nr:hypothetical protein F2P81_020661 [Scophthalmus maximus]